MPAPVSAIDRPPPSDCGRASGAALLFKVSGVLSSFGVGQCIVEGDLKMGLVLASVSLLAVACWLLNAPSPGR